MPRSAPRRQCCQLPHRVRRNLAPGMHAGAPRGHIAPFALSVMLPLSARVCIDMHRHSTQYAWYFMNPPPTFDWHIQLCRDVNPFFHWCLIPANHTSGHLCSPATVSSALPRLLPRQADAAVVLEVGLTYTFRGALDDAFQCREYELMRTAPSTRSDA